MLETIINTKFQTRLQGEKETELPTLYRCRGEI